MLPRYSPTRALAVILAVATGAAVAAPSPTIARDAAAASAHTDDRVLTGGLQAPDRLAPDAAAGLAQTTAARGPNAGPTVVEVTAAHGFDWTSAGAGRSRTTPH